MRSLFVKQIGKCTVVVGDSSVLNFQIMSVLPVHCGSGGSLFVFLPVFSCLCV